MRMDNIVTRMETMERTYRMPMGNPVHYPTLSYPAIPPLAYMPAYMPMGWWGNYPQQGLDRGRTGAATTQGYKYTARGRKAGPQQPSNSHKHYQGGRADVENGSPLGGTNSSQEQQRPTETQTEGKADGQQGAVGHTEQMTPAITSAQGQIQTQTQAEPLDNMYTRVDPSLENAQPPSD